MKRTRAVAIAFFIFVNVSWIFIVHSNFWSFFNNLLIGFTILSYFWEKHHTQFIFPKNDCTPFLYVGGLRSLMDLIISRSIYMPSFLTIWPNNFPFHTTNKNFLWFKDMPYILQHSKTFLRCLIWYSLSFEWIVISSS